MPVDGGRRRRIGDAGPVHTDRQVGLRSPARPAPTCSAARRMWARAFDLVATRASSESAYAGIVRLVEAAQQAKAPMVRLADRYALWFLAATILVAAATWIATGDPVRALAVLVVATPCPLILAVPVAIISGVSRAAKRGVLVKGGGALEALARVRTLVIDKTGTLTEGRARLVTIHSAGRFSPDEILQLAATLELASNHVVATALVAAARGAGPRSRQTDGCEGNAGLRARRLRGRSSGRRRRSATYVRDRIGDAGVARLPGSRSSKEASSWRSPSTA